MIVTEALIIDGRECVKTYSDAGVKIRGGFPEGDYDEAVDPKDSGRSYAETDIPIEGEDTAEDILNIILGVEE